MTPLAALDRWWYAPLPASRLAMLRILVGGFGWIYVIARIPHWRSGAELPVDFFAPVGVLSLLSGPPTPWVSAAVGGAAIFTGGAFVLGWCFRVIGPAFAALFLVVTTYGSSWGMIFHTENLLALHLLVLGCSPAADALSLDARRAPRPPLEDGRHGWPVRLMCLVVAATYLLAGVAKLEAVGLAWAMGETLREQIAYNGLRKVVFGEAPPPWAALLVHNPGWLIPLAWGTLAFELGAPVALLGRIAARLWVAVAIAFHLGVMFAMAITFVYPLTGVAFLCFFDAERLSLPVLRARRSPAAAGSPPA